MKARDVMTGDVVSIRPDDSVLDAAKAMLDRKISGLVVMDGGNLIGIMTEGDFLRRSETGTQRKRPRWLEYLVGPGRLADEYVHMSGRKVHEVMTHAVHSIQETDDIGEAVRIMEENSIKRVPVMYGRAVVGMITRADFMRAFVNSATDEAPPLTDEGIKQHLLAHLESQRWAPLGTIDVAVRGGVVTVTGVVLDDRQIAAVTVAAENIPGVKTVDNKLVWVEPVSGMAIGATGRQV